MIKLFRYFVLVFVLVPMATKQVAAYTDVQIAEIATSIALFPASIADAIADINGSKRAQKVTRTFVEGCYLAQAALATYNHCDDLQTNKYNVFRLLTHGSYFVKNIYDLVNVSKDDDNNVDDAGTKNQVIGLNNAAKKVEKIKKGLTATAKIILGYVDAGMGFLLAVRGAYETVWDSVDYCDHRVGYEPLLASFLSLSTCVRQALNHDDFKGRMAWVGAASANALCSIAERALFAKKIETLKDDLRQKVDARNRQRQEEYRRQQEERVRQAFLEQERQTRQRLDREQVLAFQRLCEERDRPERERRQFFERQEQARNRLFEEQLRAYQQLMENARREAYAREQEAQRRRGDYFSKVPQAYRDLGLARNADQSAVKTAYRRLATQFHPDRNHGNEAAAAQRMQIINNARDVLVEYLRDRGQWQG